MERDNLSRKLAVILHADVVGSTSLVQQNETLAHQRIQNAFHHFSETINSPTALDIALTEARNAITLDPFSEIGHWERLWL